MVPRSSGKDPYKLLIIPLTKQHKKSALHANVAILVFDTALKRTTATKLFISSYDLTPAEAQLALELAQGTSVEEFSTARNISVNTTRSQLRAIFAKTETSRQPELVSFLLRAVAGVNLK